MTQYVLLLAHLEIGSGVGALITHGCAWGVNVKSVKRFTKLRGGLTSTRARHVVIGRLIYDN